MEIHHRVAVPCDGIGIDIGSSLAKITRARNGEAVSHFVPVQEQARIHSAMEELRDGVLALTGAGAAAWAAAHRESGAELIGEFEAVAGGARALLRAEGHAVDTPILVVSIGTGTSALLVDASSVTRVGGTALGGGSLIGLGRLLCGTEDYDALAALALDGDRGKVDLLVSHIYPDGLDGVPGGLTAANFGRVRSQSDADLAHALCGLLGENLGLMCGQLARLSGVSEVVYCGATVSGNDMLGRILIGTTMFAGASGRILDHGMYCGSLGALLAVGCPDTQSA